MTFRAPLKAFYPFNGGQTYGATIDANGWKGTLVKTSGSPTAGNVAGGGVALATDSTNEAQSASLTNGDLLSYPSLTMNTMMFEVKGSSLASASATTYAFGLGTALNTTYASMTNYILFVCSGSNSIVIYASDGTNTYSAIATGQSIQTSFRLCEIDFTNGLSDVRFYLDDGTNARRRVPLNGAVTSGSSAFNLSAMTGNLQPVFFNVKTSSTNATTLTVRNLFLDYRSN